MRANLLVLLSLQLIGHGGVLLLQVTAAEATNMTRATGTGALGMTLAVAMMATALAPAAGMEPPLATMMLSTTPAAPQVHYVPPSHI